MKSLTARRLVAPAVILLAVGGLVFGLAALGVDTTDRTRHYDYGQLALGIAIALLVTRLLDAALFDLGARLSGRPPAPALLRQIVSILVFGFGIAIVFKRSMAADLGALLATSAIITAVIGLALQDTLGNLFAGLALAIERTVQVGDMVRSGETIGTVEQLSWRTIRLRTLEGNVLIIPNSVAGRDRLEIYPRPGPPLARSARVGLEYEVPPARAREALERALQSLPGVAPHPPARAYVKGLDEYAVHYELRYWLNDYADLLEVDSQVKERIWYALARANFKIAYPVIRQHQYAAGPLSHPERSAAIAGAIARTGLFAPLSDAERDVVAAGAREHRYAPGETVIREGDPGSSMFVVASGQCAVSLKGATGDSHKLALLEPGMTFGEFALLTGEPRGATVRAVLDTVLVEIGQETLAPVLASNPALAEDIALVMAERRRQAADALQATRVGPHKVDEQEPLSLRISRFFGLAARH